MTERITYTALALALAVGAGDAAAQGGTETQRAAERAAQDTTRQPRIPTRIDPRARTEVRTMGSRSAEVVAGPVYRAEGWKETVLGRYWRDPWIVPVTVPVLDLDTYAGGLTVSELGGGNQTYSLRFKGANGREYQFRSVNKEQTRSIQEDLRGTIVEDVLQDQVSSLHPGAGVIADRLLDPSGVLHESPRLFVMPDHPRLGPYRQVFAGMLGQLEERPNTKGGSEVPAIAAADDVEGSEDFFEALESDATHRFDARDYLAGRVMDLFFNDWDRHEDQYRWARYDRGGLHVWRAIPRDRDYVFVDYDGLAINLARGFLPKAVRFKPDYKGQVFGLTQNAQFMDRYLLGELDRAAWDSVARAVQGGLTNALIAEAIAAQPEGWREATAPRLDSILRARRDRLYGAAMEFYAQLAGEPEVHAKDEADLAVIDRLPDGFTEVRLFAGAGGGGAPYYFRRLDPRETREVRVFLHGGDDRVVVRGGRPAGIAVRVVGGGGDDLLADSSAAGHTVFYDDRGENRFIRRAGTHVNTHDYEPPPYTRGQGQTPPRDWGRTFSSFSPYGDWRGRVGLVLGGGPSWTRYGFRRYPHAATHQVRALWAPEHTRFGVEYAGDIVFTGSRRRLDLLAQATELLGTDFHGFGNDTEAEEERDLYRVFERTLLLEPTWVFALSRRSWLGVGPTLRWSDPETPALSPADVGDVRGSRTFGAAGLRAGVEIDRRDHQGFPRRGWTLDAGAAGYMGFADADGPFGQAHATATGYLTPVGAGPTLALRTGARSAFGEFPIQYAAFVGGGSTLRGHRGQRFAGDLALFGNLELRQVLTRAELIVKGDLGVFGLADAGRVWYEGESEGDWHTAVGGGVFFSVLDNAYTISLSYAQGELGRLYLSFGLPF